MDSQHLHEKIKEVEAWRRLAQAAEGESLLHHIGLSLYRLQGWPWVALAEVAKGQVHILLLSEAGSPKAVPSYTLEDAPCRMLYPAGEHADFMLFSNNMRRFPQWGLLKQLPVRSYLAQRLSDTRDHRHYHLIALHNNLVEEQNLPKTLVATAARRMAVEIRQKAEHRELARLQQITQHPALALAYVNDRQQLEWASPGLSQLLGSPLTALLHQPVSRLFPMVTPANLAHSRQQPVQLNQICTLADGQRQSLEIAIHSMTDGFLLSLVAPHRGGTLIGEPQPQQLTGRLEQELARLQRKGEVSALLFVDFSGPEADPLIEDQLERVLSWGAEQLRGVLRKEDFVSRLGNRLVVLTACFDHHGEVPRNQLTAIAAKVDTRLSLGVPMEGVAVCHSLRIRLITSWDSDIDEVLDPAHATPWQPQSQPTPLKILS
ncbi:hypothetical protein FCL40_04955 [Ferrimonas sediminicola]|uniref:Uncharacterized protein n=1 Tax=Ferrimonas sediminicola TaxID=2569538 RepID=A0A4U1BH09_9GAMM|nr:hypothetical protein [Ferrimonas sediminicola]TKB50501.1 hypothetical protein FCL40_04955 [Ferrimonas sediminicola]